MHTTEHERGGHAGTAKDPIPCGKNLDLAVRALADNLHIELNQPDQVCSLLDKIQEYSKQVKETTGEKPNLNLCNVSVPGTNLFCHDSIGVPRVEMPQLGGVPTPGSPGDKLPKNEDGEVDIGQAFMDRMKSKGVSITDEHVAASHLRASQNELVGAKISKRMKMIERGEYDPERRHIFITKDNYIIDGHHGWATAVAASSYEHKDLQMPVYRLNIGIGSALYEANKFAAEMGVGGKSGKERAYRIKAARLRHDARRARLHDWLKAHAALENPFAEAMDNVFRMQYSSIVGELKRKKTTDVSADDLFNPDEWTEHIKRTAREYIAKAAATGAKREYDRAMNRTKAAVVADLDLDRLLIDLPPDALEGVQQFIEETMGKDYWDKLSQTTRDRLQDAIDSYVVEGDPASADNLTGMVESINEALGPEASLVRAITTARTETTGALNAGTREVVKGLMADGLSKGYEWLATEDQFTRETHLEANGQRTSDFF